MTEHPPRISVMLATPPGFNPGMIATELALLAFLRRHDLLDDTQFFRSSRFADRLRRLPAPERELIERRSETGIAYGSALDDLDAVTRSDVILYWADFLHMAQHLRELRAVVSAPQPDGDGASIEQVVNKLFLLAEADESTLRRTMSFGTSLLFNTLHDEADAAYAQPLRRLLKLMRRVWVRDALSAARVAHLRRDYRTGYFGVDCALLLRREDVLSGAAARREVPTSGPALVFLGREPSVRDRLTELAWTIARTTHRSLRWLPWGDPHAFPVLGPAAAPPALPDSATTQELLQEVARAWVVVTDTYHLAVMAWSLGVPAVVAFSGHTTTPHDVSSGAEFNWRDKRETFCSQYDALDFLVRPEELRDRMLFDRRARHVVDALEDPALCAAISANIRGHANAVEADLAHEIRSMLAR